MTDMISSIPDQSLPVVSQAPTLMKLGTAGNIDKAAHDFEAMFATQMLQPMFEGVGVDPTFGGGHGEEVMKSFLLQEYGKIFAKGDRLGVASLVKKEMLRAQEGASSRSGLSSMNANQAYANASASHTSSVGGTHVSVQ